MFFNPHSELDVKLGGNLPHWHQNGKIQFVTFRLADSLPTKVLDELRIKIEEFKNRHSQPWSNDTQRKYWKLLGPMEERILDNGHGSCVLKSKEIRQIVKNAILYRDGCDYNVFAYVIMPNHVHLLIQPLSDNTLSKILHSIKRFTAKNINVALNRKGQFWMNESFDRIVRSIEHFNHCIRYIESNPKGIEAGHYDLYIRSGIL